MKLQGLLLRQRSDKCFQTLWLHDSCFWNYPCLMCVMHECFWTWKNFVVCKLYKPFSCCSTYVFYLKLFQRREHICGEPQEYHGVWLIKWRRLATHGGVVLAASLDTLYLWITTMLIILLTLKWICLKEELAPLFFQRTHQLVRTH